MFPIRDHNPSLRTPYVNYLLIIANCAVFSLYFPLFSDPASLALFFDDWAMIPARLSDESGYLTLFSSMFLHGGLLHLGFNMLFLWVFGDNLENELGHIGYLVFYLFCGTGAGVMHWASDPASLIPTVGASGAIAGVMGGYLLLFPKAKVDILFVFIILYRIVPVPAWLMLGFWFGLQVFNGLSLGASGGGVAYWAHAGGFVIGFLFIFPLWLRKGGPGFWRMNDGHPPHPEARYKITKTPIPIIGRRK